MPGDRHNPLAEVRVGRPARELVGGGVDLAVNGEPPLAQPMEDIQQARRQARLGVREHCRQATLEQAAAQAHDDPVLQEQRAHLVHHRRAFLDGALPHPVERLELELLHGLQRHTPHTRPAGGLGDRGRIMKVVLVRLHVRLHELRR